MILVIDNSRDAASSLSDMLHYLGILSRGVTPTEALREISPSYRAVIVSSLDSLPDGRDYLRRLRRYALGIPIFSVGEIRDTSAAELLDATLSLSGGASGILGQIQSLCNERALPLPGRYLLAGIDISAEKRTPEYFGISIPFTKTECMILRSLISSYPTPICAERILDLAYRQKRRPEVSNVRTHISVMNKKFSHLFGRNIIYATFGEGYSILTPEAIEKRKVPVTL